MKDTHMRERWIENLLKVAALLAMGLLVLTLAGCMTVEEKKWTCDTAQAAYLAYQATIEAGRKPSDDEIYAAAAAAAFLRIWCGWESPTARVTMLGIERIHMVDSNCVPIIEPAVKKVRVE